MSQTFDPNRNPNQSKKANARRMRRLVAAFACLLFVAIAMQNCQKAHLDPLEKAIIQSVSNDGITVNFCTDPAYDQKLVLKTIIILDHSGSNQKNYKMSADGTGAPALENGTITISNSYATDPTGTTRYGTVTTPGSLLNYLSTVPANNPADPTRFFALVDFNAQADTYPTNSAGFTSDTVDFYNHVLSDSQSGVGIPTDGGSTSYISALSKAYAIMTADVQQAKNCAALAVGSTSPGAWCPTPGRANLSSYVVVFMSDGAPITDVSGVGTDANGNLVVTGQITITMESTTDILGKVSSMAALTSNAMYVASVNLFSIYYYKPGNIDATGQALLASMAKAGNGVAYNALSGSSIDYSQFQPPAKKIKYTLSDIFVSNASVSWWTDAQLHLDTDMDGLPDDVERSWGSNPALASSDGNGVTDLVKYRLKNAAACTNKNSQGLCTDSVTNYKSGACSGISTSTVNGVLTYKSSDPNGLNDCEKTILGDVGGIGMPDSNGDSIPDWLEFKNSLQFQAGTQPSVTVATQDGYSQYQKVKLSLPTQISLTQVKDYVPATYNLTQVSTSTTQDCYSLQVNNLPIIGANNTIRVDVIEKTPQIPLVPLYRVAKKQFATGSNSLVFADWNNAAEKLLNTWKSSP